MSAPQIVGDAHDVHVEAVVEALRDRGCTPEVFDAGSLEQGAPVGYEPEKGGTRGWIRRLARPDWYTDIATDGHAAAVRGSWVALLIGRIATTRALWLTDLAQLQAAENKVVQLTVANTLGVPMPRTVITADAVKLSSVFGDASVVVKPLGTASYTTDAGEIRFVAAQAHQLKDLDPQDIATAPFVFQEQLQARTHLRVVTVLGEAFVASLDGTGLPLDWREEELAHSSFRPTRGHQDVGEAAVRLAKAHRVGFSSQDWIVTDAGAYFLDLNPAGQWLFLPEEVAEAATNAIAGFLAGA